MTNKQAETVVSFTVSQRYDFLELINAMKDLDNQISEGVPLEYNTIEKIRHSSWILSKVFNFAQPRCEHGHTNHYSDYIFSEDVPRENKRKDN
tara:strand:- start:1008 stop:1286 length:279 start_codon:yes stop_codon:yes gene_type:complete